MESYPNVPQPLADVTVDPSTGRSRLPPIIAALWSDVDLVCEAYHSEENAVYFEETTDPASLSVCASIVEQRTGDTQFRPQSMLIFTWDSVQPYDCPRELLVSTHSFYADKYKLTNSYVFV